MRFCTLHAVKLENAVRLAGLWPLCSVSDHEVLDRLCIAPRMVPEETGTNPLVGARLVICGHAVEAGGLETLIGCPLCKILRQHDSIRCEHGCSHDEVEARWIANAVGAMVRRARSSPTAVLACPNLA